MVTQKQVTKAIKAPPGTREKKVGQAVLGYQEKRRGKSLPFDIAIKRYSEIGELVKHRYPLGMPATDPLAPIILEVLAHHIAHMKRRQSVHDLLRGWCLQHARAMPPEMIAEAAAKAEGAGVEPWKYRADRLAWRLGVTLAEREALDLRTIGAVDAPKEKRAELVRQRDRIRDRESKSRQRRAAGARLRADYEAESISSLRPWELVGKSRSWFYRQSPANQETLKAQARAARRGSK